MTAIIARMHRVCDEQLSLSEIRERFLAHDKTYGGRSQIRVAYDLKAGAYRVWTSNADTYEPMTPGYQETGFGLDVVTVTTTHMSRHEHGFRRIECPPVEQDLADIEADEWTARLERELDDYLASLE